MNALKISSQEISLEEIPQTNEFFEKYRTWLHNSEIHEGIGGQKEYSLEEIQEIFKKKKRFFHWCIYLNEAYKKIPVGDLTLNFRKQTMKEFEKDSEFKRFSNPCEITLMLGESRGKGIGKKAIEILIKYLKENNLTDAIYLTVYKSNKSGVAVYQRNGFEIIGEQIEKESQKEEFVMRLVL